MPQHEDDQRKKPQGVCCSILKGMPRHVQKDQNCQEENAIACMTLCHGMQGVEKSMPRHSDRHAEACKEEENLSNVVCRSIQECMPQHESCSLEKTKEFDFV